MLLLPQVARSGSTVEDIARRTAATGGRFQFLISGEGYAYYLWQLHKIRSALAAASATADAAAARGKSHGAQAATAAAAAGDTHWRQALTVEERMALLGETPLPASGAAGSADTLQAKAAGGMVSAVAVADRKRLQLALNTAFVRGSTQDMDQAAQQQQQQLAGLRKPDGTAVATSGGISNATAVGGSGRAELPSAATAFLASVSGRFAGGSSSDTAMLHPELAGSSGPQTAAPATAAVAAGLRDDPQRSFEDWRPEPLLCKRFNVPDPYKGKPVTQAMSRFKTDYLSLPETLGATLFSTVADHELQKQPAAAGTPAGSALAEAGAAGVGQVADQQLPGMCAEDLASEFFQEMEQEFAKQEAVAAAAASATKGAAAAAAAAAARGLGSSIDSDAAAVTPETATPGGQGQVINTAHAATAAPADVSAMAVAAEDVEKPLDLFKAIFEDESDAEEDADESPKQQNGSSAHEQQAGVVNLEPPALGVNSMAVAAGHASDVEGSREGADGTDTKFKQPKHEFRQPAAKGERVLVLQRTSVMLI